MTYEIIEGLNPCPKCGKYPVSMRHIPSFLCEDSKTKPYAVCCGGEGCCFYVMGETPEEAINTWQSTERKKK